MENNEKLNKRIIENVRNRVVISNLEREEIMKLIKRKQVMSVVIIAIIMLTGGFAMANAVTNGELANKVKETINVIFVKDNGEKEKIENKTYSNANNHTIEKYEINKEEENYILEIDKTNIDQTNINVDAMIKNDESSIEYNNK